MSIPVTGLATSNVAYTGKVTCNRCILGLLEAKSYRVLRLLVEMVVSKKTTVKGF